MTNEDYHVFDNMMKGVLIISKDWKFIYANQAAILQGKSNKESLLGYTLMEKYLGIEDTEMFKCLKTCMIDRVACQMVNEFQFPNHAKGWFDLRMDPVDDGVLIMSLDVTKQRKIGFTPLEFNERLENMVAERTKELMESLDREKRLSVMKSAFVSIASHEFRTPLSTILSSVSLAQRYVLPEEQVKREKHLLRIRASVKNLTDLLNDFLSLDKLEQGKVEPERVKFDLPSFLHDVTCDLDGMLKSAQAIKYEHYGQKEVMLDKKILRNVLFNLLSNAVKYSEKDIKICTEVANSCIKITISDQGIGIPEKDQKNLFNMFFRAKNAVHVQGTGLGLNIVKRYVELLNGTINFKSKEQEGTTFIVTFQENIQACL